MVSSLQPPGVSSGAISGCGVGGIGNVLSFVVVVTCAHVMQMSGLYVVYIYVGIIMLCLLE